MSILIKGIDLPAEGKVHRIVVFPNGKIALDFKKYVEEYEAIQIPRTLSVVNVKRGWIPVSELLPKEGRPVLVSVKFKARLPKWVEKPTYYYMTDIDVYDDYGWRDNGKNVVAWQPLPAPYKGE